MRRLANHILALMAVLMAMTTHFLLNECFILVVYLLGLIVVAYGYFFILVTIRNKCLQLYETKLNKRLENLKGIANNKIKETTNEKPQIKKYRSEYSTRPTSRKGKES